FLQVSGSCGVVAQVHGRLFCPSITVRRSRRDAGAGMGHGHSHSHDHDRSAAGLRALWISLAVLGATAAVQAVVVAFSGSVALLGDTLHNVADALTAVPLGVAFLVGRRTAMRGYCYGYWRARVHPRA